MKNLRWKNRIFTLTLLMALCVSIPTLKAGNSFSFKTRHITLSVDNTGKVTSIRNTSGKEFVPKGHESALLSLHKKGTYIHPVSASFNKVTSEMQLTYPNGSVAKIQMDEKEDYLRWKLLSVEPRNGVDNIVWGPYNTTISKYIGDVFSVVRDDNFTIGIMAIDDNTTSGPPCDGEMSQSSYIIHSPDPKKYPVPGSLKEGQRFRIGGDGNNDVAFFSHPEEYYRYMMGNGAKLEPQFGSSIVLHSRDRSIPHTIFFPEFNDFPSIKAPRHLELELADEDFAGSTVAFYDVPTVQD